MKIKHLIDLFPYFPVGLESNLMAQYRLSIQNSAVKYRLLFYISEKFCQLRPKSLSAQRKIFNYEINVLDQNPNRYVVQKHLFHLFSKGSKADYEALNNKEKFHKFCIENELPTPQLLGKIQKGMVRSFAKNYPWDNAENFFVKPVSGSKSKGILEFRVRDKDTYEILDQNRLIKAKYILEYLRFHFKTGEFIIQEKVSPPHLFNMDKQSHVPILRIISYKKYDQIQIMNPVLIIHKEKKFLDSRLANKDFFAIDATNGSIIGPIVFDHIPPQLEGFILPDWLSLLDLIKKAHIILKNSNLIGWDIAIGKGGYTLLEANQCPWLEIHQKKPFDDTCFIENILTLKQTIPQTHRNNAKTKKMGKAHRKSLHKK